MYRRYKSLADQLANVRFVGRLATYQYYDMDQVVAQALAMFDEIYGTRATATTRREQRERNAATLPSKRVNGASGSSLDAAANRTAHRSMPIATTARGRPPSRSSRVSKAFQPRASAIDDKAARTAASRVPRVRSTHGKWLANATRRPGASAAATSDRLGVPRVRERGHRRGEREQREAHARRHDLARAVHRRSNRVAHRHGADEPAHVEHARDEQQVDDARSQSSSAPVSARVDHARFIVI